MARQSIDALLAADEEASRVVESRHAETPMSERPGVVLFANPTAPNRDGWRRRRFGPRDLSTPCAKTPWEPAMPEGSVRHSPALSSVRILLAAQARQKQDLPAGANIASIAARTRALRVFASQCLYPIPAIAESHKLSEIRMEPSSLKPNCAGNPRCAKMRALVRVLTFQNVISTSLPHTARYSPLGCQATRGSAKSSSGSSSSTLPVSQAITCTFVGSTYGDSTRFVRES